MSSAGTGMETFGQTVLRSNRHRATVLRFSVWAEELQQEFLGEGI